MLAFYVIFPSSSWTPASLCCGAGGSCPVARPREAFLAAFGAGKALTAARDPPGIPLGWSRVGALGIRRDWRQHRGTKLLQEQLQLCFELFLPAWGVSGPRCDSGRGGAVGLTARPLFIRWQGRTGSARESREALYKQGEERQREGSGLEIAAVNTTRFTPGQLGAG